LHIKGKNGVVACPQGVKLTKIEATRFT
jgi:hypothetical protein